MSNFLNSIMTVESALFVGWLAQDQTLNHLGHEHMLVADVIGGLAALGTYFCVSHLKKKDPKEKEI